MFKKNSWIVALLLALTLTALFTGCIDALAPEEEMTYTEVDLGDFNIWGGQNYQRGWAVAGMKFSGVADKTEVAADKGYKNENFQKATKLVIEMSDATHPNGNLDIIWGAADDKGNSVGQDWVQTGSIKSTKDGNILTIDLTAMKGYASFKGGNYAMRKIVLQAGGEKAGLPFVKKAKLLIPDKVAFIPVKDMKLSKSDFAYTLELKLSAEGFFTPEDATNQIVNWSIVSWTPKGGNSSSTLKLPEYPKGDPTVTDPAKPGYNANYATELAAYNTAKNALLAKVDFKPKKVTIRPEVPKFEQGDTVVWDWTVQPPQKITISGDTAANTPAVPGLFYDWHENDVIVAIDGEDSMGTVVVLATVVNGVKMPVGEEGKKDYVEGVNFTKEFSITIKDVIPFKFKVAGADQSTIIYGAQDNSGNGPSSMIVPEDGKSYTLTIGGGYGNSYSYFEVKLGTGSKIGDYKQIKLKYTGVSGDCDLSGKTVRAKAMATIPPSGYNPGVYISSFVGEGKGEQALVANIGKDEAKIYDSGAGNDATMQANVDGLTADTIYVWFLPWCNGGTAFKISDIEFIK